MDDPRETRLIHTRDGVARIPRSQQGTPLRDYFQNTELPENLEQAHVFHSANGPVLATPDPVPWQEMHDKKVQDYADRIKNQIDEKGYYSKTLSQYADRLADQTGYPKDEMKAMIVAKFDETYSHDPFDYLQQVRADQGLPVRERDNTPSREQDPEM
ncbi:hypothetical protein SAMN04488056_105254 [Cohaesibacter marisflavi]|uniref:Uncharacterized protein n=1 Tax=Cohaesibacter marisflavi TaxID=655353 RepID=A0A1I5GY21_9HYPH|nr:hypothetical protein [Cohaesibacter marisflavi]SFO40855.1 hypothetical protein SAMN04488056_105254 [Cohaesibacter marisflavi]